MLLNLASLKFPRLTIPILSLLALLLIDITLGSIFNPPIQTDFRTAHPYYHHDLLPNMATTTKWGKTAYPIFTNSLGFKDKANRQISLQKSPGLKRIVFIGDGFTEGIGLPYEQTFVGQIDKVMGGKVEVLNAGAVGYSPKLYYHKIQYWVEQKGLQMDELFVLVDVSDMVNEIKLYKDFVPSKSAYKARPKDQPGWWSRHSLIAYGLGWGSSGQPSNTQIYQTERNLLEEVVNNPDKNLQKQAAILNPDGKWVIDKAMYEQYGVEGFGLCGSWMEKLAALCYKQNIKMTIVVYPWPAHLYRQADSNIMETFWELFAANNQANFIDLFPYFLNTSMTPDQVYERYFIYGDVHWNLTGHELVAKQIVPYIRP